ncbi:hypothetical protein VNO77_16185 [Canavalia gladiata]|uniref:DUF7870 domain-containing protein n=1 Tax=Canavalia gladiata TaxID=3824 RepID=A0AAN9M011_CANGL
MEPRMWGVKGWCDVSHAICSPPFIHSSFHTLPYLHISMDSKLFKFHALSGSIARRVFFRALFLASAVSIVSLLRFLPTLDFGSLAPKTYVDCIDDLDSPSQNDVTLTPGSYLFQSRILNTFWGSFDSINCQKDFNLTCNIVTQLMGKRFLDCDAKALCIGEGSPLDVSAMQRLGFSTVTGLHNHPFFSPNRKQILYHPQYNDSSFDFVLSKDFYKVSLPALLVLEVERVLKPGGIGAMLVTSSSSNPHGLMKSATPVSSLLRSSSVVHVDYINDLSLVVFKKISENENLPSPFYNHALPQDCASVAFTKPLVELMEPLVEERLSLEYEKRIYYLPKFVDVSNRKRLVYIDIGVEKSLNANNVTDWFPPHYPVDQKAFSVYFVHYNSSVLLSYVKRPRVTFVYHPGLAGKVDMDPFLGEGTFDFLVWFKETVQHADFVVLKMNAGKFEMKFLSDIFESGAICFVDELFLSCSDSGDGESHSVNNTRERCMDIYKGLRSNGVYVHQWWDTQGPQVSYAQ